MPLMIVHHRVRDYTTWRPVFDAHEPVRTAAGLSNGRVYHSADNPNDLILLFDFADRQKAEEFATSDELKTAMQRAGVEGRPEMHFTESPTPAMD